MLLTTVFQYMDPVSPLCLKLSQGSYLCKTSLMWRGGMPLGNFYTSFTNAASDTVNMQNCHLTGDYKIPMLADFWLPPFISTWTSVMLKTRLPTWQTIQFVCIHQAYTSLEPCLKYTMKLKAVVTEYCKVTCLCNDPKQ